MTDQNAGRGDCENCPKVEARFKEPWVAPQREVPLSGILNVDKPPGMTSHDVVDAIRRVVGQRKVGHAGTLDPMATGVLLVCLGQATRVSEYLMAGRKRYRATIVLGTTTDTYDADGMVLSSDGRTDYSQEEIEMALAGFVGSLEQVPPMYSAIKQAGQPLHKLARQGKTVAREPRLIQVYELELLDWQAPALIVEVSCSPGTYIRSLAHDLGRVLGSGAHLGALVRLGSGRFVLEDAVSLGRLEEAFRYGKGKDYLVALDEALLDWPAMVVGSADVRRITQGQAVPAGPPVMAEPEKSMRRAYSVEGDFVAIMAYHAETELWRPKKVFAQA